MTLIPTAGPSTILTLHSPRINGKPAAQTDLLCRRIAGKEGTNL